jgi:hypothetical protein
MALIINRVLDTRFELQYNGGNILSSDKNTLFTDGSYCHFKTGTGANIIKEQNLTFADVTVIDTFGGSGTFTFANIQELWIKLIDLKFFDGAISSGFGGGLGASTFAALTDTPTYFGNNGKVHIVNEAENKLDAVDFYNFDKFTQLSDVEIESLIENTVVGVTSINGEPKLTLVKKPEDGAFYFSAVGGFDYNDLATQTTPLSYTTGDLQLTNDALGDFTFLSQPPYGITTVWDEETNTFDFSQLSIGDEVFLRIHINLITTASNQVSQLKMLFGEGTDSEYIQPIDLGIAFKSAGSHDILRELKFYIGNEDWRNTPAKLLFSSDASASIEVYGWHPYIIRKSINILDVQIKGSSEKPDYVIATEGQTEISFDDSADNIDIWINQVIQREGIDYNVDNGLATMTYPLSAGDLISHRTHTLESTKENFIAIDGNTTVTLSNNPRTVDVWVNQVMQTEGINYSKSNNIINFTSALSESDYVVVRKHR